MSAYDIYLGTIFLGWPALFMALGLFVTSEKHQRAEKRREKIKRLDWRKFGR